MLVSELSLLVVFTLVYQKWHFIQSCTATKSTVTLVFWMSVGEKTLLTLYKSFSISPFSLAVDFTWVVICVRTGSMVNVSVFRLGMRLL